eukprot:897072-Ditylum_brightwellii.AAC.1
MLWGSQQSLCRQRGTCDLFKVGKPTSAHHLSKAQGNYRLQANNILFVDVVNEMFQCKIALFEIQVRELEVAILHGTIDDFSGQVAVKA